MENIFADIRHLASLCQSSDETLYYVNNQIEHIENHKDNFFGCWLDDKILDCAFRLFISKEILLEELKKRKEMALEQAKQDKENLAEALDKYKHYYEDFRTTSEENYSQDKSDGRTA